MNLIVNSVTLPEPSELVSEWVTAAGVLYRQVTATWSFVTGAQAATILGAASPAAGVPLTYISPVTNASVSFTVKIHAASVPVLREETSGLSYAPLVLTLREVVSP